MTSSIGDALRRDTVYRWFNLRVSQKREIAVELGILDFPKTGYHNDTEYEKAFLTEVGKRGLVEKLTAAVQREYERNNPPKPEPARRSPVPSPSMDALREILSHVVMHAAKHREGYLMPGAGPALERVERIAREAIASLEAAASPSIAPLPDGGEVEKLIERLQERVSAFEKVHEYGYGLYDVELDREAATEIARLSTRLREAKEALAPFARAANRYDGEGWRHIDDGCRLHRLQRDGSLTVGDLRRARALSGPAPQKGSSS